MSDHEWDKDDYKIGAFAGSRVADKWEGEDEDDDVKDNWDDDDAENDNSAEVNNIQKQQSEKVNAKKGKKSAKIKELDKYSGPKTAEEILSDKLEKQRLVEESDLILAKEAFGVSSEGLDVNLASKDDFDAFKKILVEKLSSVERSPYYVPFLENMFRELCVTLEPDDIKRISGNLNALFNEKVKAQKIAKPKKKGKGYTLKMERNDVDFDDGGDLGNDFDDFM